MHPILFVFGFCFLCFSVSAAAQGKGTTIVYFDDAFKAASAETVLSQAALAKEASVQYGPFKKAPVLFDAEDLSAGPNHSNVIIASASLPTQLPSQDLVEFVQRGGNLMIVLNGSSAVDEASYRKVLQNFGVEVLPGRFESFSEDSGHLIVNPLHAVNTAKAPKAPKDLIAFRLQNDPFKESTFNPLIHPLLSLGPKQAVCTDVACVSAGPSIAAVATLESRNGGRVLVAGSVELVNRDMLRWVTGDLGRLRLRAFEHELTGDAAAAVGKKNRGVSELKSTIYRIGDVIRVRMCLETAEGKPFVPGRTSSLSLDDFQVELKMMTIEARVAFESVTDDCLLSPPLHLPTTPAIYTLRSHVRRPGYTLITASETLLVRPYRHDEFDRFLVSAMPYYASWASLLVGTFLVLVPFMLQQSGTRPTVQKEKAKRL